MPLPRDPSRVITLLYANSRQSIKTVLLSQFFKWNFSLSGFSVSKQLGWQQFFTKVSNFRKTTVIYALPSTSAIKKFNGHWALFSTAQGFFLSGKSVNSNILAPHNTFIARDMREFPGYFSDDPSVVFAHRVLCCVAIQNWLQTFSTWNISRLYDCMCSSSTHIWHPSFESEFKQTTTVTPATAASTNKKV